MELIRGLSRTLKKSLPKDATAITAAVFNGDIDMGNAVIDFDDDTGLLEATIPYAVVETEGGYTLRIYFTMDSSPFQRDVKFNVVTPYLDLWQLKEILDDAEDDECWMVESAARYIINSHCGQSFGKYHGTVKVSNDNGPTVVLPEHTLSVSRVVKDGRVVYDDNIPQNDTFLGDRSYYLSNRGWFFNRTNNSTAPFELTTSDPIVVYPANRFEYGRRNAQWEITGVFGYEDVPPEVVEAMKLLVNDYACSEQIYRDRFLESITASDWRLQFNDNAYADTGNARANTLLAPWVVNRMMVL